MKLPGELRNNVYRCVLVDSDAADTWIHVRVAPNHRHTKDCVANGCIWREPGILQASKEIRAEASAIYYANNEFELGVTTKEFEQASQWIRTVVGRCGIKPFKRLIFDVRQAFLKDLGELLPLARLLHDTGVNLGNKKCSNQDCREDCSFCVARGSCAFIMSWSQHSLRQALKEVARLGVLARNEDWSSQWLDVEFGLWLDEKLRDRWVKQGMSSSRKRVARNAKERQAKAKCL